VVRLALTLALLLAAVTGASAVDSPSGTKGVRPSKDTDTAPLRSAPVAATLTGRWTGSYVCGQGATGLTLTLDESPDGALEGTFAFFPLGTNPDVPAGRFRVSGTLDRASGAVSLQPGAWIDRPPGYVSVGLAGTVDGEAGAMRGTIRSPGCSDFRLTREE